MNKIPSLLSKELDNNDKVSGSNQMRILLADDHDLVRDTIAAFLRAEGKVDVVTVATLDAALIAIDDSLPFNLVLLDFNMPGMNGLSGLKQMKRKVADCPVAILSGSATPTIANDAIANGASGFLPKTMGAKAMLGAIHFMNTGEVFVPFDFMQQAQSTTVANLTERETEVLRGLCEAKSNKEIARGLDLQEVTIKLHVKTLCRKLDARNRTQAAMIARDRKLI